MIWGFFRPCNRLGHCFLLFTLSVGITEDRDIPNFPVLHSLPQNCVPGTGLKRLIKEYVQDKSSKPRVHYTELSQIGAGPSDRADGEPTFVSIWLGACLLMISVTSDRKRKVGK